MMHPPLEELLHNVGFTARDRDALRAFWPSVQARLPEITRLFTDTLALFDRTRGLRDGARVGDDERLRQAIARSLEALCLGARDAHDGQGATGFAHVRETGRGLAPRALVAAMHTMRDELLALAEREAADVAVLRPAIVRVIDVELALLLEATVEQRERALLRDALDGSLASATLLVEADGRVVATTTPASPVLARRDVAGEHVRDALRPAIAGASAIDEVIARAIETRQPITLPRVETDSEGVPSAYRVTVLPVDSAHAHALVHIEDVTDVVAQERQVRRREHAARMRSLASTVAHEIRNPLAAISGTVQVVAASMAMADERREALQRVQDQVIRLGDLCGDLLAFSQPHDPRPERAELAAVVSVAVAQVDSALSVATRIEGEGRAFLDPALFTHVIFNVVENAWQAGARKVLVRVEDGAVRVLDDGSGIPPDAAARLFEPFFTTKTRGTGLGLPIAQKILEAMGGTLSLCPSPLGGAGFLVRVPTDAA